MERGLFFSLLVVAFLFSSPQQTVGWYVGQPPGTPPTHLEISRAHSFFESSSKLRDDGGLKMFCPLSQNNENFYLTSGGMWGDQCSETGSNTCCSSEWFELVGRESDPFQEVLREKIPGVGHMCRDALVRYFSCGVCSPFQGSISDSRVYGGYVFACYDVCASLLDACGSETLGGVQISTQFENQTELFCQTLFSGMPGNLTVYPIPYSSTSSPEDRGCISSSVRECTLEDVVGYYSECDLETLTRSYYSKYSEEADCLAGFPLPETKTDLPCYQSCEPGEFLPSGQTECSDCPGGYFSVGGGYQFNHWKDWPDVLQWETYCEENKNDGEIITADDCPGWVLNDTFIESPDSLGDKQRAVLVLKANLVQEGSIKFSFKVSAEQRYDGLKFYDGETLLLEIYSVSGRFDEREFTLAAGLRELKWVFFKDVSGSQGLDQAFIRSIEIQGVRFADNYCDSCVPGTYSEPGSATCYPCPSNTFSNIYAAGSCQLCEPDTYSDPGSYVCLPRLECEESDIMWTFSPCDVSGTSRTKTYSFKEPVICLADQDTLPEPESVECADCNPGQYREQSGGEDGEEGGRCKVCPEGTYSEVGATECRSCSEGTYAKKSLYFTQFDQWSELPGVTSGCVGECGTEGWRLLGNDADSGVGHGNIVDSYFDFSVTMEEDGIAQFVTSIVCASRCRIMFQDSENILARRLASSNPEPIEKIFTLYLAEGRHDIQVIFSKYDATVQGSRNDRLIVHEMEVSGVTHGGSASCESCSEGYFSQKKSAKCTPCPAGTTSQTKAHKCVSCADQTFAATEGSPYCSSCAPNTESTSDHTDCDYNECVFSPAEGVTFDLAPLERADMYGPIWDEKNHSFYLNPCKRNHSNRSCTDEDGKVISSHACQGLPMGYSVDLGHQMGFEAVIEDDEATSNPLRSGVVMIFQDGTPGCKDPLTQQPYARESKIHFICDPSAGKGYPMSAEETEECRYEFWWPSLYGCPVCTEEDYTVVYSACEMGHAVTTYVPKSYPNRCHGGVSAPEPVLTPCTEISIPCDAGTYFPLDSEEDKCVEVGVGHFSVGGGLVLDWFRGWDEMPEEVVGSKAWLMEGELLKSGAGDTKFVMDATFVKTGTVSFTYKVIAEGLNGGFQFFIDDLPYFPEKVTSTNHKYTTRVVTLQPGKHILVWSFEGGSLMTASSRGNYVAIDEIQLMGTKYADRQQTPCKEGYYQSETGKSRCKECGENTKSSPGAEECVSCPEGYFSLQGGAECSKEENCEQTDFTVQYSTCKISTKNEDKFVRTKTYVPLSPVICEYDDVPFDDDGEEEECPSCQPGFRMVEIGEEEGYVCKKCGGKREILVDGECVLTPNGTYPVPKVNYLNPEGGYLPVGTSILGEVFHSFCTGECGTNGWRELNGFLESGYHSIDSEVESVLTLSDTLELPGTLSFTYKLFALLSEDEAMDSTDNGLPGVQFFIERNKVIEEQDRMVPYHPTEDSNIHVQFDLIPGNYVFKWVFHQPLGTNRHKRILLSDVNLVGSNKGGAEETKECSTGTYYNSEEGSTLNSCTACEPGQFAPSTGLSACLPCDEGEYSESGAAWCTTCLPPFQTIDNSSACGPKECIFTNNDVTFDLTSVNYLVKTELMESRKILEFSLCDLIQEEQSDCYYDPILPEVSPQFISHTHACSYPVGGGEGTGGGVDAGSWMEVKYLRDRGDGRGEEGTEEGETEIQLRYTGDKCEDGGVWGNWEEGGEYEVVGLVVRMKCYLEGDVLMSVEESPCQVRLNWHSLAGCRVCTDSDYKIVEKNQCDENNQMMTSKVRISDCNGPEVVQLSSKKCTHSVSFSFLWLLFIFILFLAMGVSLILILLRNAKLADKYQSMLDSDNVEIKDDGIGDESL